MAAAAERRELRLLDIRNPPEDEQIGSFPEENLAEQAARATDGKASRRRRNPRGVTKWGPTVMTDRSPEGRFSGLRSGFRSGNGPIWLGLNFRKAFGFGRTRFCPDTAGLKACTTTVSDTQA